jgi:hypothetical protein
MADVERHRPSKRKAGEECERNQGEAAGGAKKMSRLPKKEIDWILAQANEPVWPEFRDLKRANPSLVPSPEEEKDKCTSLLYLCAHDAYEDEETFAVFQAWVRSEYAFQGVRGGRLQLFRREGGGDEAEQGSTGGGARRQGFLVGQRG